MNDSARLAIAAHLHVLLRRKTGRVIDTEWLAKNAEYATEILRFARAQAIERSSPELTEWASRLEGALRAPAPVPAAPMSLRAMSEPVPAQPPDETPAVPAGPRYIGGIR